MKGINKVTLVGCMGQNPDIGTTPGGINVTHISLATGESFKDKDGSIKERTEWHKVVFFGKLADIVGKYTTKGSRIYVEGSLRTRKFLHNNIEKTTTEIIGSVMQMLDTKKTNGSQSDSFGNVRQAEVEFKDDTGIPF